MVEQRTLLQSDEPFYRVGAGIQLILVLGRKAPNIDLVRSKDMIRDQVLIFDDFISVFVFVR